MSSTITDLKQQVRNKDRVSVFIDGAFAFGLPAIVAAELRIGQELTAEKRAEIEAKATDEEARQSALNFLSYRPRSSAEIRRNLNKKKYEPEVIEMVIEWLKRLNYVNDADFVRYWIEQRETFKPRSAMALRQELMQKGVDRELIDDALSEIDETDSARRLAHKRASRWLHLPEPEFRLKLGRYLQGRGFHYGIIREICDEIWQQHEDGEIDSF